ncbi:MAG: hypothetical protein WD077_05305 [Bacteroidia bacterium]
MKNKNQLIAMLTMLCIVLFTSCKKEEDDTPTPAVSGVFLNLTFNTKNAYFSTDGSMSAPVDSGKAKTMTDKIDITFIFNYDYVEAGFFDPIARSQVWYWDDYYNPWLSTAVETRYYSTTLTKADFDAAQADKGKIATYFSDTSTVLAPHEIFPEGSCIGGRQTHSPESVILSRGQVFGFKNTSSGKRGLLYIRTDQYTGWPAPFSSTDTKVDIIREN